MGFGLRQVLDGQRVVQKKAETEYPAVYQVIHILASGHERIEWDTLKKLPVQNHGAAESKGGALEARPAADDLIKRFCLAAEAVPIGHPWLRAYIVVILAFAVEVVAGHAVHDVPVDSSAQKFHRAGHKIRQLKHLIIINEQRGICRQDRGSQQTDVAHIGISKHGKKLRALAV